MLETLNAPDNLTNNSKLLFVAANYHFSFTEDMQFLMFCIFQIFFNLFSWVY